MKKNTRISAIIQDVDDELRGTFQSDGIQVGIPGSAPGDELEVKIVNISQHKPAAWGKVIGVVTRGEAFVRPPCPHAAPLNGRCGGCPAMHLTPSWQDKGRLQIVQSALSELAPATIRWVEGPSRLRYRNRSNYYASRFDGQLTLGSFAPRTREIVAMDDCLIVRPIISKTHRVLQTIIRDINVPVDEHPDALRWVCLRAIAQEKVVVELIVRTTDNSWVKEFVRRVDTIPFIQGVGVSINNDSGNAIRIHEVSQLTGALSFCEKYGDVELEIPGGAFTQLNTDVASQIYKLAVKIIQNPHILWDLYCGVGGLSLNIALNTNDTTIYGADSTQSAVAAAQKTAIKYNVSAHFVAANLSDGVPKAWPTPTAIVVNPPRRGLDNKVLQYLLSTPANELLYMSCGLKSFVRDARTLQQNGWHIERVDVFDMLPQTTHVELLAKFIRN